MTSVGLATEVDHQSGATENWELVKMFFKDEKNLPDSVNKYRQADNLTPRSLNK